MKLKLSLQTTISPSLLMHLIIGITDTKSRFNNYQIWIKAGGPDIEIIQLTPKNAEALKKCDGVVLSGGIDTHPKFYNSKNLDYPNAPNMFDQERDKFEIRVFSYAKEKGLPVLAICRGMQLVNVALGGDLVQDIEATGKNNHRRHGEIDGLHEIIINKHTLLHEIAGIETGTVNSAHHQAVKTIAPELIVNAWSPDGIAEGMEWKDKPDKPFLLCVQWHPERLVDKQRENPLTKNIRKKFIEAIKNAKER
jgi:putative glutamine amidotransferase